jgi:hypothetical protein
LLRFQITVLPSLVLFENEKVVKVVATEEKINKIINNLSLDIEKSIKDVDLKSNETNQVSEAKTVENKTDALASNPTSNTNNNIINDSQIISESQNINTKV